MVKSNKVFLLLGSNIEPRYSFIKRAEERIAEEIGEIIQFSEIYESKPIGFTAGILFLNRVLLIYSMLSASNILINIHEIENDLGRKRSSLGYSSRTIDIDILYYNNDIISNENLTVPHPRLHERKFTLLPLAEIAPDYINPILKKDNSKLLELCADSSKVNKYKNW